MSSSSSKTLVLWRPFFGGGSSSSKKRQVKPHHAKSSAAQSSCSEGGPYDEESKSVGSEVESKICVRKMITFVVVHPGQKDPMKSIVREKRKAEEEKQKKKGGKNKRHGTISTAVVTTQDRLQRHIDVALPKDPKEFTKVCIIVGSGVESITYQISDAVEEVYVVPYNPEGQPNKLRIGSSSTFCGVKAYAWPQRQSARDRRLEHAEGCYFNFSDVIDEASRLLQPQIAPEMSEDALSEQFSSLSTQLMRLEEDRTPESQKQVSLGAHDSSLPAADGTGSWFDKSKGLLATIVGLVCGAGAGAMTGGFVVTSGGISLSGPLGFSLTTKYFCAAGFGAACGAAAATTIVAGAAVYLIPWGTLWEYVKDMLWSIWSRIGDMVVSVLEKVKAVVMSFVSKLTAIFPSFSVSGPRVHSN
ncbi:hypothetical protein EDB80DRAFT_832658 [Ilyonectria destructans]|nr:hypothetical protein EDB80DRAFT_832658 [Ilyonectria destructans]